jgi:hypothetical protein
MSCQLGCLRRRLHNKLLLVETMAVHTLALQQAAVNGAPREWGEGTETRGLRVCNSTPQTCLCHRGVRSRNNLLQPVRTHGTLSHRAAQSNTSLELWVCQPAAGSSTTQLCAARPGTVGALCSRPATTTTRCCCCC